MLKTLYILLTNNKIQYYFMVKENKFINLNNLGLKINSQV